MKKEEAEKNFLMVILQSASVKLCVVLLAASVGASQKLAQWDTTTLN